LNNALGYAEQLEAHTAAGSQNSLMFALTATQQRLFGGSAAAEGRLGQTIRSFAKHSSFSEQLRGLSATLADGPHRGEYELAWRQLSDPTRAASTAVRQQLGHSLKSSLKHTYTHDGRDAPTGMPTRGVAVRTATELAGVGPADLLRFVRAEAECAGALPLVRGVALALSLRAGVMLPWGAPPPGGRRPSHIRCGRRACMRRGVTRPIRVCAACIAACAVPLTCVPRSCFPFSSDRFFLGGPDSLRGFCTKGAGPTDARRPRGGAADEEEGSSGGGSHITRDSLGGDLMCSGSAAVTFQVRICA
jgi:outer membrane protein insertion porin family